MKNILLVLITITLVGCTTDRTAQAIQTREIIHSDFVHWGNFAGERRGHMEHLLVPEWAFMSKLIVYTDGKHLKGMTLEADGESIGSVGQLRGEPVVIKFGRNEYPHSISFKDDRHLGELMIWTNRRSVGPIGSPIKVPAKQHHTLNQHGHAIVGFRVWHTKSIEGIQILTRWPDPEAPRVPNIRPGVAGPCGEVRGSKKEFEIKRKQRLTKVRIYYDPNGVVKGGEFHAGDTEFRFGGTPPGGSYIVEEVALRDDEYLCQIGFEYGRYADDLRFETNLRSIGPIGGSKLGNNKVFRLGGDRNKEINHISVWSSREDIEGMKVTVRNPE